MTILFSKCYGNSAGCSRDIKGKGIGGKDGIGKGGLLRMKKLLNSIEGSAKVGKYMFKMVLIIGLGHSSNQRGNHAPGPTAAAKYYHL